MACFYTISDFTCPKRSFMSGEGLDEVVQSGANLRQADHHLPRSVAQPLHREDQRTDPSHDRIRHLVIRQGWRYAPSRFSTLNITKK